MAAFGTGVNPALGRIDYTPYLQGSLQGSAAIGRGIASLGESAAGAIKEYTQNKETRDLITQNNENQAQKAMKIAQAFQNNPDLFGKVPPISEKTFTDLKNMPSMSMGKLKALNAELNAAITKYEPVLQKFEESENTRMRFNIASQLANYMDPLAAANQAGLPADQAMLFATGFGQRKLTSAQTAQASAQAARDLAAITAGPPPEKQTQFERVYNAFRQEAISNNNGKDLSPEQERIIAEKASQSFTGKYPGEEANAVFISKWNEFNQRATQASNVLPNIAKAKEILQTTQTGFGAELKDDFRSIAKSFGFPVNEQQLNNSQLLKTTFGNFLLNIIQQTKGSTSDKETSLFQSMSAGLNKTPEANNDILDLYASVAKRDIEARKAFDNVFAKTKDLPAAYSEAQNVINKFDNSYMEKIDDLSQKYVKTQTPNIPASIAAPKQGNGSNLTNSTNFKDLNDRLDALKFGLRNSGANSNR